MSKLTKIQQILSKIGADETYTKKEKYKFDKVHDNAFPMSGYNEFADLLMLPTTKENYKYLLCMVDIWSNYVDFEPLKTKTAKETLAAMLKIFKRNYVVKPKASLKTDNGSEFKEVFDKWLKDHHIAHLVNLPDRHQQMANVENLNKQVGRIINTYLTAKSVELGHEFREWLSILPIIRVELNKMKKHYSDEDPFDKPMGQVNVKSMNKYNVGDIVMRPLEKAESINGEKLFGGFRSGDRRFDLTPRKITKVFLYNNNFRYKLDGFPDVSYAEAELKKSQEKQEKWEVKKIIDKRIVNKKVQYKIWWKGYLKKDSTFENRETLLEDLGEQRLNNLIKDYEETLKKKK